MRQLQIKNMAIGTWGDEILEPLQTEALEDLESGKILYMPDLAFSINLDEEIFLSPIFLQKKIKNISYHPQTDILKGAVGSGESLAKLKMMIKRFSHRAIFLIKQLFPFYNENLEIGRTSFRPAEINHRNLSYRKDDTRLHVDAFSSSPTQGRRILRVFSNINHNGIPRVWRIGENFENVAEKFIPLISRPLPGSLTLLEKLKLTRGRRTLYDHFMLKIHNKMKKDLQYQKNVTQIEFKFPSATTWIVQTDEVSHAAMSGQHLLEQTFYLPFHAMKKPEKAPIKVLERLMGKELS